MALPLAGGNMAGWGAKGWYESSACAVARQTIRPYGEAGRNCAASDFSRASAFAPSGWSRCTPTAIRFSK